MNKKLVLVWVLFVLFVLLELAIFAATVIGCAILYLFYKELASVVVFLIGVVLWFVVSKDVESLEKELTKYYVNKRHKK